MVQRIRVLTDSVADVPRDLLQRYQIRVLPVYLMLDGQTYLDDGGLEPDWFYQELARVQVPPTTAAPSPKEYVGAYEALAAEGAEEIIVLCAASTVSSLYDHAVLASQEFDGARVHVVDTLQVTMGMGWMVVEAAHLVAAGRPIAEVLSSLHAMRARTRVYGVLDSVDYLRRSGRVGWAASSVADLLQIRPVIAFEQGEAKLQGRVRLSRRGVRALVKLVGAVQPVSHVAILHSGVDDQLLDEFQTAIGALVPDLETPIISVGGIFATHVGPRCLGVALVRTASI